MRCANCEHEITGAFCSNCGRPAELPRIGWKYVVQQVRSVMTFDKGILFTIRELLLRPGENVRKFIRADRNRLVKPIVFLIVCSLIYTLAQKILGFEDGYVNYSSSTESTAVTIYEWIQQNYGYSNILMGFFAAFWTKILFRKSGYNLFEILVLLFFIMGIAMLIYTIFGILDVLIGFKAWQFGGALSFIYLAWAMGQFFGAQKIGNYIKALLAYFLGLLSFSLSAVGLGLLIDIFIRS